MPYNLVSSGSRILIRTGLIPALERRAARCTDRLPILVYHRIGEPAAEDGRLDPSLLSATPAQFSEQMQFLSASCRPLALGELLGYVEANEPLPTGAILVTFDDGYRNFYETAWPVLERFQVPAVMFLATDYVGTPDRLYWWDELYQAVKGTPCEHLKVPGSDELPLRDPGERQAAFMHLKQLYTSLSAERARAMLEQVLTELAVSPSTDGLLLSWPEVRELQQRGCVFAAHTRSHPILSRISTEQALEELRGSQSDIARETGTTWPVAAYPSGHAHDCNAELDPLLQRAGFCLAMSSIPGINRLADCNPLRLRRIGLAPWMGLPEFRLVLTEIYGQYCSLQSALHRD